MGWEPLKKKFLVSKVSPVIHLHIMLDMNVSFTQSLKSAVINMKKIKIISRISYKTFI